MRSSVPADALVVTASGIRLRRDVAAPSIARTVKVYVVFAARPAAEKLVVDTVPAETPSTNTSYAATPEPGAGSVEASQARSTCEARHAGGAKIGRHRRAARCRSPPPPTGSLRSHRCSGRRPAAGTGYAECRRSPSPWSRARTQPARPQRRRCRCPRTHEHPRRRRRRRAHRPRRHPRTSPQNAAEPCMYHWRPAACTGARAPQAGHSAPSGTGTSSTVPEIALTLVLVLLALKPKSACQVRPCESVNGAVAPASMRSSVPPGRPRRWRLAAVDLLQVCDQTCRDRHPRASRRCAPRTAAPSVAAEPSCR